MSRKMYDVLLSVGDFPHRVIPIAIVDWTLRKEDWFEPGGELKKEICLWNYLAIQITEHLDIFDHDKSEYWKNDEDEPDRITSINKYVFKIPKEGLPPIFKIKTDSYYTFISSTAREALQKAKISGLRLISLDFTKHLVDVPVILTDE